MVKIAGRIKRGSKAIERVSSGKAVSYHLESLVIGWVYKWGTFYYSMASVL